MNYSASRLKAIQPSASVLVSHHAKALKAEGYDVVDLGLGEPDFDTPPHIIEAAHTAALAGETRYPPLSGTADLKNAILSKLERDNQLIFSTDEILVSNGVKQVLFEALMASMEPEQEVLLCAPYFGPYRDMVLILGGKPVVIPCSKENGFRLTPEKLDAAISSSTRWLFLNVPSNPAGVIYTCEELQALGKVLEDYPEVLILSDEIYEQIVFDNRTCVSFVAACPELRERTLTANGVSKAFAMTGWRIGYGAGPQALISAMTKVQSQISSGACSIAQAAATAALNGSQGSVIAFRDAFERRRNLVMKSVAKIPGLSLGAPCGAFYAFIECSGLIGATTPNGNVIEDDTTFTQFLLEEAKVAVVPGSAYGLSPFFRISTAASDVKLSEAMDRIALCVSKLNTK